MKRDADLYLKSDLCLLSQYGKMSFLDKMVTGNEKCICNEIPKLRNPWLHPGQLQHWNLQVKKYFLNIWWDSAIILFSGPLKILYSANLDHLEVTLIPERHFLDKEVGHLFLVHELKWNILPDTAYFSGFLSYYC